MRSLDIVQQIVISNKGIMPDDVAVWYRNVTGINTLLINGEQFTIYGTTDEVRAKSKKLHIEIGAGVNMITFNDSVVIFAVDEIFLVSISETCHGIHKVEIVTDDVVRYNKAVSNLK